MSDSKDALAPAGTRCATPSTVSVSSPAVTCTSSTVPVGCGSDGLLSPGISRHCHISSGPGASLPASSRLKLPASVCHSRTACSAGTTRTVGPCSQSRRVVMLTPRASPIFTTVPRLGLVRACSIWMSMPRLTPARAASASRVKPRSVRQRLTLRARDWVSRSRSATFRPCVGSLVRTTRCGPWTAVGRPRVHRTVLRGARDHGGHPNAQLSPAGSASLRAGSAGSSSSASRATASSSSCDRARS